MAAEQVVVQLRQEDGYRFVASYADGAPAIVCDEPPPLGQRAGPSPVQLLATAVGNCLSDSLLFAFRKFKQAPEPLASEVVAQVGRNPEGRIRVLGMRVTIRLGVAAQRLEHLERVLSQFEAFCTVTQSVAPSIPVDVLVHDASGARLK
ncbi:MAG TPA: OsmC family protein [Burkholderiaceae bacterium]|nr:OsmC family protein [Burkholderiaceae bacterium]